MLLTGSSLTAAHANAPTEHEDEPALARVSPSIYFDVGGQDVRVKVYTREIGEAKNHPLFKFGDLIQRAITYQRANPNEQVVVNLALYQLGADTYIGVTPGQSSYAYVKGYDHDGDHSRSLPELIVDAGRHQVEMNVVYHKDLSGDLKAYVRNHASESVAGASNRTVGDYVDLQQVQWGNRAFQQMHAKFMTVNVYARNDGSPLHHTTYISTANGDDHDAHGIPRGKDWEQSGILVNQHPDLQAHFDRYFWMLHTHYDDQGAFHNAVRTAHNRGTLNYADAHFESFFFPIPKTPAGHYVNVPHTGDRDPSNDDAWDPNFNPIAKYTEILADAPGERLYHSNVYHMKTDNFVRAFFDRMEALYRTAPSRTHLHWRVRTNTYQDHFSIDRFNAIGEATYRHATHTKDTLIGLPDQGIYYTLTGSANMKLDEHVSKANATLVIKETGRAPDVYSFMCDVFW